MIDRINSVWLALLAGILLGAGHTLFGVGVILAFILCIVARSNEHERELDYRDDLDELTDENNAFAEAILRMRVGHWDESALYEWTRDKRPHLWQNWINAHGNRS